MIAAGHFVEPAARDGGHLAEARTAASSATSYPIEMGAARVRFAFIRWFPSIPGSFNSEGSRRAGPWRADTVVVFVHQDVR
jgi:hypothetical protein